MAARASTKVAIKRLAEVKVPPLVVDADDGGSARGSAINCDHLGGKVLNGRLTETSVEF